MTTTSRVVDGCTHWRIHFSDGHFFHPEYELVSVAEPRDPLDLLRTGQLGRAADLRKRLTHVRLSGRLANIIYSMETTNTDFYAYQFKPVLKFLSTPAKGLLIADEVGLGKTIEAGLIWTEMRSRLDYRRLLVLCPAVLKEKWRMELQRRFGINAQLMDAKELHRHLSDPAAESRQRDFAAICTMSSLRPRRGWDDDSKSSRHPASKLAALLDSRADDDPLIDLLIIDEAHYLRNPETLTNSLGTLLAGISDRVVMLSATPVHLRSRDLFQLLMLADRDTFSDLDAFDSVLNANAPLVEAREALLHGSITASIFVDLLRSAQAHPFLADNRQLQGMIEQELSDEDFADPDRRSEFAYRLDQINLLGNVISRTRKREVQEFRVLRSAVPEKVAMNQVESALYISVTAAVREFAERYEKHQGFLLVTPQRQMSSSMPAAVRGWLAKGAILADTSIEDFGIESDEDDGPTVTEEIIRSLGALPDYKTLRDGDSKFELLANKLTPFLRENPDEKIVVFSYFRATLDYLHERLAELGISAVKLSGDPKIDKNEVLRSFESPHGPRVLISSEVGSEGVDLQFCRVVVNYDLPWNPMRLEQRIGRLDRLGQKAEKILIWNLMYDDTIDSRIYDRLYERLELFNRTLGGLEAMLGGEIRRLTNDLLTGALTPEEELRRIDQSAQALVNLRKEEERLEDEAPSLIAYGDYILTQVRAARELNRWISGDDIRNYVIDFFREYYVGCRFEHRPTAGHPLAYEISLTTDAKYDLQRFLAGKGLVGKTGLANPDSTPIRCVFENKMTTSEIRRVEIVSQVHPLTRFVGATLADKGGGETPPLAVRVPESAIPSGIARGTYVFLMQRWSIGGVQEKEFLFTTGVRLESPDVRLSDSQAEQLLMNAASHGLDWLEAPARVDLQAAGDALLQRCMPYAAERFRVYVRQIRDENSDRANLQRQSVERHYARQLEIRQKKKLAHIQNKRPSLIAALDGQIKKLENITQMRLRKINEGMAPTYRSDEICIGLISVGN